MTLHLGKVKPGSTIYIPFDTFAGSTGASVTMTGLAVTDIEIYKNGSTTQRASDTGYTLLDTDGIDFDALTGIHGFSVDLSSNADAGFFVAGGFYWVVVSAITVDSQTVSFVAATFTLGYEGALLDTTIATLSTQTSFTLTAGPAEDDALNGCEVIIHDIASAVQLGRAFISDYTGSTKTVTLVAGTTFTAAAGDNISVFRSALQPTVQGRALDVSTGGEAGVDWANVGTPGSTVALSATTVAAVTTTTTATNVTTVNGLAANVITAASIATGAIDADAIAVGAIGASELATDAVDEIVDAVWDEVLTGATHNVASSAGRRLRTASGGQLDSGTAQAGGADSITLATSASTTAGLYVGCLIAIDGGTGAGQSRYIVGYTAARVAYVARHWTTAPDNTSTYVLHADNQVLFVYMGLATAGAASTITLGAGASSVDNIYVGQSIRILAGTGDDQVRVITAYNGTTKVATVDRAWTTQPDATSYFGTSMIGPSYDTAADTSILADTNDIQTRLPAALVSGRMDASVGAMAANTLTASALATDAVNEIVDQTWDEAIAGHAGAGSTGAALSAATAPTAAAVADAVWDETLGGHLAAGSTGEALNAAGAAGDPWTTALPGAYGSGSAGHIIGNRLVGTIASGTHNPQSGDAYARLGAPAGASVSADIADLPTNAELATSQAAADDATLAAIAALNNLSAAQVNAEVDTALADANLDHLVGTATGIPAIPAGTYLDQIVDDGTAAFDRTTDSLQAIRDRGDAAWDTADVSALALEATAQSILTDTAEIGTAGAGLTNINLPNQTMDIVGNITGNLSGSVGSVTGAVGSVTAGVTVTTNNDKTGYALSTAGVDAILDDAVEGAYTFRQFLRLFAASLGGKLSGAATTTVTIRNLSDSKDVVVATVDADGNRSAVTLDLS